MIPLSPENPRPADSLLPAVLEILERLAREAGVGVARTDLRRAVERAARDARDWDEVARRAGLEVGLDVRAVRVSLNELERRPSRPPLVTVARDGDSSAVVVDAEAMAREVRRSRNATAADTPMTFLTATPRLGLDLLESPPGDHWSPVRRLVGLVKLERDDVWVALVYAVAIGVFTLVTPLGVQLLVNTVALGALVQPVVVLTILVFAGLAFAATLRALQAFVLERMQERVFVRVALDFSQRLPRVQADALRVEHGPEIVNRFFELVTIQKSVASLLVEGTALLLQSVLGLFVLSLYHPYLLVVALVLGAVVALVFVLGHDGTKTSIQESKAKYALAAWLQELARHPLAFRSESGAARAAVQAEDLTRGWLTERRAHFRVVFRQVVVALAAQVLGSAALLGVGGWLVVGRQLTLGQLVAAELIVTAVLAAISKLGKHFETYYDLLTSLDKVGQVVDLPLERAGGSPVSSERPVGAELEDMSVEGAIERASLRIPPGARLAILDARELGARAIVDALGGFVRPTSGLVSLGGVDIRELDLALLRDAFAVVRGPELFAGTIAENVGLGRVGHAEVRRALEAVGAWQAIAELPNGVETEISTHGGGLAPSLALRITLARAVVNRPRMLVLDRALDALPDLERRQLLGSLGAEGGPWTLLVTTRDRALASLFPLRFAVENRLLTALPETVEAP